MSAPHANAVLFARGTLARLALWPTLRLAVHAAWGGPASAEKQRWLAGVLVDQFEPFLVDVTPAPTPTSTSALPDETYVEDLLLQIMSDEFDVVLEDGSAAAVAGDLCRLFAHVRTGDDTLVRELEAQAESVKGKLPAYEIGASSGSETESESEQEDEEWEESKDESAPQLLDHSQPRMRAEQVDEDGFTIVKRKGHR